MAEHQAQFGAPLVVNDEIEDVLAPYLERKISVSDSEWKKIWEEQESAFGHVSWYRRIRQFADRNRPARQIDRQDGWEKKWHARAGADPFNPDERKILPLIWRDHIYFVNSIGYRRVFQYLLLKILQELKPRSVLEMGCGDGLQLMALASAFPDTEFCGIDISASGLATANSFSGSRNIPDDLRRFLIGPAGRATEIARFNLVQASGERLPFQDEAFDVTYTVATLEQMKPIAGTAISEIARVTKTHAVLIEPWREFNSEKINRNYVISKGYLDCSLNVLQRRGLEPVEVCAALPSKPYYGYGAVIARKIG